MASRMQPASDKMQAIQPNETDHLVFHPGLDFLPDGPAFLFELLSRNALVLSRLSLNVVPCCFQWPVQMGVEKGFAH